MNFARIPSFCAVAIAVLIGMPLIHCVDDRIGIEPDDIIFSGWVVWRLFATLCGWHVPDVKSPEPGSLFRALGANLNLSVCPHRPPFSKGTEEKRLKLLESLLEIRGVHKSLASEYAGQI